MWYNTISALCYTLFSSIVSTTLFASISVFGFTRISYFFFFMFAGASETRFSFPGIYKLLFAFYRTNRVTKTQPIFEKKEQTGTLAGFRLPAFTSGVNVPGYHLHFLSFDNTFGGHVLEFSFDEANIEIQEINNFYMILTEDDSVFGNIDLSKDRTKELHEVEKQILVFSYSCIE